MTFLINMQNNWIKNRYNKEASNRYPCSINKLFWPKIETMPERRA